MPHPPDVGASDKLSHFAAYGTLMFWFAFLYRRTRTRALYAAGFIAMGVAIEFLQGFTGRHFEVADMFANTLGVLLGAGAALVLLRLLK
ncbi:MAG TPA: VanZ family protein [Burkholderiales bacterium]|nr:VanZ family protein [Burkholderiales bacterium]